GVSPVLPYPTLFRSLTQPWRHDPTAGTRGGAMRSRPVLFIAYLLLAFGIMGANPFRGESITPLDVLVKQHAFSWADEGQPARHRSEEHTSELQSREN